MRIDTHLPTVYLGSTAAWPRAVVPVVPGSATPPAQRDSALRLDAAIGAPFAASHWPASVADSRLGLRVRQALDAYTTVRDGDQRDYLRRVMGLEATA